MSCTHHCSVVNQPSSNLFKCQWFRLTFIAASHFCQIPLFYEERRMPPSHWQLLVNWTGKEEKQNHKGPFVAWKHCKWKSVTLYIIYNSMHVFINVSLLVQPFLVTILKVRWKNECPKYCQFNFMGYWMVHMLLLHVFPIAVALGENVSIPLV